MEKPFVRAKNMYSVSCEPCNAKLFQQPWNPGQHTADSGYMTSLSLVMLENFDIGNCTDRQYIVKKERLNFIFMQFLFKLVAYTISSKQKKYENYQFCKCTGLLY